MNKWLKRSLFGLSFLMVFALGAGLGGHYLRSHDIYLYNKRAAIYKPWFVIPKDVQKKVLNNYVSIRSGKNAGSGCKIKPGYYLTALHILADGIFNNSIIIINDQQAKLVGHSNTDQDIAIISTFAEFSKEEAVLEQYNDFEDDQDVIIVGNSGPINGPFAQPGKILHDAYDELGYAKTTGAKIISGQYIDHGISGGCVYSADGEKLLGIVTKKYDSTSLGEVAPVSRSIK